MSANLAPRQYHAKPNQPKCQHILSIDSEKSSQNSSISWCLTPTTNNVHTNMHHQEQDHTHDAPHKLMKPPTGHSGSFL